MSPKYCAVAHERLANGRVMRCGPRLARGLAHLVQVLRGDALEADVGARFQCQHKIRWYRHTHAHVPLGVRFGRGIAASAGSMRRSCEPVRLLVQYDEATDCEGRAHARGGIR